jgi:hypothetical protein
MLYKAVTATRMAAMGRDDIFLKCCSTVFRKIKLHEIRQALLDSIYRNIYIYKNGEKDNSQQEWRHPKHCIGIVVFICRLTSKWRCRWLEMHGGRGSQNSKMTNDAQRSDKLRSLPHKGVTCRRPTHAWCWHRQAYDDNAASLLLLAWLERYCSVHTCHAVPPYRK